MACCCIDVLEQQKSSLYYACVCGQHSTFSVVPPFLEISLISEMSPSRDCEVNHFKVKLVYQILFSDWQGDSLML